MSEIRELRFDDVAAVADLCGQLGYPATPEQIARRFSRLLAEPSHAAFVAVEGGEDGEVAGWLHVFLAPTLESDLYAEIGGLVVAEAWRSRGLGARLVAHARAWAAERGVATLRVRSRTEREAAHRFYRREGFVEVKRQLVLVLGKSE